MTDSQTLDPRALRNAFGAFATGVTVVTTRQPDGTPRGFTANSFTSVSLDPPLVLWCPSKASARFSAFTAAGHYAIHVLAADQFDLCHRFARAGGDFAGLDPGTTPEGLPLLSGCIARFDCAAHAVHDGGDHAILVGRVLRAFVCQGKPLLFWHGRYGDFLHRD